MNLSGITFAPDGTLYGADPTSLYRINPATGAAVLLCTEPNMNGGIFTATELRPGWDRPRAGVL